MPLSVLGLSQLPRLACISDKKRDNKLFSGSPANHSGTVQTKRCIFCAPLLSYQKFKREEGMIRSCINFALSVALTTKRAWVLFSHFVFQTKPVRGADARFVSAIPTAEG